MNKSGENQYQPHYNNQILSLEQVEFGICCLIIHNPGNNCSAFISSMRLTIKLYTRKNYKYSTADDESYPI